VLYPDNGKGLDIDKMKSGGIGMKNMESCVQVQEGIFTIHKKI
jgi:signal transduction histidine kinase